MPKVNTNTGNPAPSSEFGSSPGRSKRRQSICTSQLQKQPSPDDLTASKILAGITAESIPLPDTQFIRRVLENSRRAKSNKKNDPPRPPNAFFLFRNALHTHLSAHNLKVPQVSSAAGRLWDCAEEETKSQYTRLQEIAKFLHLEMHPGYVYRPRKSSFHAQQDKKDEDQIGAQENCVERNVESELGVNGTADNNNERKGRRNSRKVTTTTRSVSQSNVTNLNVNQAALLSSSSPSTNSSNSSVPSSPEKSSPIQQKFNVCDDDTDLHADNSVGGFGSCVDNAVDNLGSHVNDNIDNFGSSVGEIVDNSYEAHEKNMKFRASPPIEFAQKSLSLQPHPSQLSYNNRHGDNYDGNHQFHPTSPVTTYKLQPTSPTTTFDFSNLNLSPPQFQSQSHMPLTYSLGGNNVGFESKDNGISGNRNTSVATHVKSTMRRGKVVKIGSDSNDMYVRPMVLKDDPNISMPQSSNESSIAFSTSFSSSTASISQSILPSPVTLPQSVHSSFLNHHHQIITFNPNQADLSQLQERQPHPPNNNGFSSQNSMNMETIQPYYYFYQQQPLPNHRTQLIDPALISTPDLENSNVPDSTYDPVNSEIGNEKSCDSNSLDLLNDNRNSLLLTKPINGKSDKINEYNGRVRGNEVQHDRYQSKTKEHFNGETSICRDGGTGDYDDNLPSVPREECLNVNDGYLATGGTTNRAGAYLNIMDYAQKQTSSQQSHHQQRQLHQAQLQHYRQPLHDEQYNEWINWSENFQ
ncbi:12679_t:CDS:2 [Acaulospora morrowiae]|uniref:12679_t:CDS:1 n=1 Tax=Acaulospora morrowiae TaxID=94023 RepID=A0A9N8YT50_9GLOM|nr:12679_t:CDS:2 [Acaulospora morrowiae]